MKRGTIEVALCFSVLGAMMATSGHAADGTAFESVPFHLQVTTPNAPIYDRVRLGSKQLEGFRDRDFEPKDGSDAPFSDRLEFPIQGLHIDLPVGPVRVEVQVSVVWEKLDDSGGLFDHHIDSLEPGNTPIYDRAWFGGSNQLRGFRFRDVGPQNSASESAERAAFLLRAQPGDSTFLPADRGMRIDLPIGPVRVEVQVPASSEKFDDSGRRFNYNIDSPGPGYRQQRETILKEGLPN